MMKFLTLQSSGSDPKKELDKAQFNRMQELLKRKRQSQREIEVKFIVQRIYIYIYLYVIYTRDECIVE